MELYAIRLLILLFGWNVVLVFYVGVGIIEALMQLCEDMNNYYWKGGE